jgi:hypothetical protein
MNISGLNLGLVAGYADWDFLWLSSFFQDKDGDSALK